MGIRQNFGYNLILAICNYLCPIIVFPYVSHVLGVRNVGICGFVDSIIEYFIIFSMLGISGYGVREIARCRDNITQRNAVFTNLFIINILLTVVAVAVLLIATSLLPQLEPYRPFLLLGIVKIVFNLFLIEWFFQGLEQFKYITMRSVLVRVIYVIAVLLFVRDSGDIFVYYLLTTLVVAFNAVVNWNYSRRFRSWNFNELKLLFYLLPILSFGYNKLLTSMYTTFNTLFLRYETNDVEVGYFTTAMKLYYTLMAIFSAFTITMIPKVSTMFAAGEKEKLQHISNNTFMMLFTFTLPVIYFSLFFAPEIIHLVAGAGYDGAVAPFRIVVLLLLIIGMEQVVIQQFLMASTYHRSIVVVSTVGAIVGICLNIFVTPLFGAVGASIAWLVAEIAVLVVGVVLVRKYMGLVMLSVKQLPCLLWTIPYILLDAFIFLLLPTNTGMYIAVVSNILLFFAINMWLNRNNLVMDTIGLVLSRIIKRKV